VCIWSELSINKVCNHPRVLPFDNMHMYIYIYTCVVCQHCLNELVMIENLEIDRLTLSKTSVFPFFLKFRWTVWTLFGCVDESREKYTLQSKSSISFSTRCLSWDTLSLRWVKRVNFFIFCDKNNFFIQLDNELSQQEYGAGNWLNSYFAAHILLDFHTRDRKEFKQSFEIWKKKNAGFTGSECIRF
jgi:hypothetical protein